MPDWAILRGDGRANIDFSIFRSFALTESKRLEFRAEAFNLTNSPIWANPNTNISTNLTCGVTTDGSNVAPCSPNSSGQGRAPTTSSLFGVVNSTATSGYSPRQIQFALKFYY